MALSPVAQPATGPATGPVLALDVDGVLNIGCPGEPADGFVRHRYTGPNSAGDQVTLYIHLNPRHGAWIQELAASGLQPTWSSTWRALAVTWIAPRVGLPDMPWIDVGPHTAPFAGRSPKLPAVLDYAGTQPLAWIDDDIGGKDVLGAEDRTEDGTPTIFLDLGLQPGLRRKHIDSILAWMDTIR